MPTEPLSHLQCAPDNAQSRFLSFLSHKSSYVHREAKMTAAEVNTGGLIQSREDHTLTFFFFKFLRHSKDLMYKIRRWYHFVLPGSLFIL